MHSKYDVAKCTFALTISVLYGDINRFYWVGRHGGKKGRMVGGRREGGREGGGGEGGERERERERDRER